MKKSLIAGAGVAALAMAAFPFALASAARPTESVVDHLTINLSETCSLARTSATPATAQTGAMPSDATWTANTETYEATLVAGKAATIGTTVLTTICNDTTNGYNVTATFSGLTKGTGTGAKTIAYDGSAPVADNVSSWNVTNTLQGGSAALVAASGDPILPQTTTATAATTNTLVYKVGTTTTQDAGTYTGTATYTLTYGPDQQP